MPVRKTVVLDPDVDVMVRHRARQERKTLSRVVNELIRSAPPPPDVTAPTSPAKPAHSGAKKHK